MPSTTTTVFDQLGGPPAISAAVDLLYDRLQSDVQLSRFFTGTDMPTLRRHMRMFLAGALGGPDLYRGRDLTAAHTDLGITDDDFDHTAGHLVGVLKELQVPAGLIEDVMVNVGSLRPQIVGSAAARPGADRDQPAHQRDWGTMDGCVAKSSPSAPEATHRCMI